MGSAEPLTRDGGPRHCEWRLVPEAHRLSPDRLGGQLSHLRPRDGVDVRGETFLQPMMIFSHLGHGVAAVVRGPDSAQAAGKETSRRGG
jgi:hypothetical protein